MDVPTLSIELEPSTGRKVINGEFRILKKIGHGQFGKVLLAEVVDPTTKCRDHYVAIKTIKRIDRTRLITKAYLSQTTKIKREIAIMKECNHPNVVKLYLAIDDLQFDKILLVLEYCKYGEIDWRRYNHYYEKYQVHTDHRKPLTINKILRDVINGLEYLHSCKKIVHRDLKPSNLLINSDNTIKISDFGVSLILENNANDAKELGKTMGTPAFFAPELCQFVHNRLSMITNENHRANKVQIDAKIDLWSLGVILYCLIFNDLPFSGFNEYELFKNIVKDDLRFPKIKQSSKATAVDIEEITLLKDLIKKLLTKDPHHRISLDDVKSHAFTTFDLSPIETKKFTNFNRAIFRNTATREELADTPALEAGFSTKIKRLFAAKPDPIAESPQTPLATPATVTHLDDLEPVDDLLDSYLDDSSSFGSDIDDVEKVVDTTNMLRSLDDTEPQHNKPNRPTLVLHHSTFEALNQAEPKLMASPSLSTVSISDDYAATSPHTPTNSNSVTIGAGLPSSAKSLKAFFSPSRRFFSRNKLKKNTKYAAEESPNKPTISSLSSPAKNDRNSVGRDGEKRKFTDLMEPPPIFGLNALGPPAKDVPKSSSSSVFGPSVNSSANTSPTSGVNASAAGSRKNSISSSTAYGLSRITSSSSSLNLNAYLTEDSFLVSSLGKRSNSTKYNLRRDHAGEQYDDGDDNGDGDDDNDIANETLVLNDEQVPRSMHSYLDSLG